jgi:small subunit ribosomal protein S16
LATVIRLTRKGRTHTPFFHVGVFDSRTRRDGTPIETLGWFDPRSRKEQLKLDVERVRYWLGVGAKPSATVGALLKGQGFQAETWIQSKKVRVEHRAMIDRLHGKKKPVAGQAAPKDERKVKRRKKARTANSKARKARKKAAGAPAAAAPAA